MAEDRAGALTVYFVPEMKTGNKQGTKITGDREWTIEATTYTGESLLE